VGNLRDSERVAFVGYPTDMPRPFSLDYLVPFHL
jgi:hypothetical protein